MERAFQSERRRRPRASCRRLSVLLGEGRVVSVEIRNISEFGVGLVSGEPLPERATLQLTRPGEAIGCEIERVFSQRAPDEDFYTGACFCEGVESESIRDYIRQALHAG